MRKIALLLSVATALVVASIVVPTAAAKEHGKENGDKDGGNDVAAPGDRTTDVGRDSDGKRFPQRYAAAKDEPVAAAAEPATVAVKKQSSKKHNAKLLNRLGMKRIRTSGGDGGGSGNGGAAGNTNHHRKRLASQSRSKYGIADGGKGGSDSQVYIVKLPPHPHFYDDGTAASHQRLPQLQQQQYQLHNLNHHPNRFQPAPYKNLNTVPVGFVSNGKPAKVYHWNLPVIKQALAGGGSNRYKSANDVQQQQQHHLQQILQYGDFEPPSSGSKLVPRRTLYYKPRAAGKPVKKSFVNNGKPNGFYVVSAKSGAAAVAQQVPQYHKIVKAYYGNGNGDN